MLPVATTNSKYTRHSTGRTNEWLVSTRGSIFRALWMKRESCLHQYYTEGRHNTGVLSGNSSSLLFRSDSIQQHIYCCNPYANKSHEFVRWHAYKRVAKHLRAYIADAMAVDFHVVHERRRTKTERRAVNRIDRRKWSPTFPARVAAALTLAVRATNCFRGWVKRVEEWCLCCCGCCCCWSVERSVHLAAAGQISLSWQRCFRCSHMDNPLRPSQRWTQCESAQERIRKHEMLGYWWPGTRIGVNGVATQKDVVSSCMLLMRLPLTNCTSPAKSCVNCRTTEALTQHLYWCWPTR